MSSSTFRAVWTATGEEFICWQAARGNIGFRRPSDPAVPFRSLSEPEFWRHFRRLDGSTSVPAESPPQPKQVSLFG